MSHSDLLSAFGALALVLGLIVLLRYGLRLVGPAARLGVPSAPLLVAGRLGLDNRRRLYLVEAGTGQVLVLTGGASDVMLPWPPHAGSAP